MSAIPKRALVEPVAMAIHRNRQELGFGGQAQWEYEPDNIKSLHRATAQAALAACHFEELAECLRLMLLSSEGQCAHDPDVLVARQNKSRAVLVRLGMQP